MPFVCVFTCLLIFFLLGWSHLTGKTTTSTISGPRDSFSATFKPDFICHCPNFPILDVITYSVNCEQKILEFHRFVLSSEAAFPVFTWIPCV